MFNALSNLYPPGMIVIRIFNPSMGLLSNILFANATKFDVLLLKDSTLTPKAHDAMVSMLYLPRMI